MEVCDLLLDAFIGSLDADVFKGVHAWVCKFADQFT